MESLSAVASKRLAVLNGGGATGSYNATRSRQKPFNTGSRINSHSNYYSVTQSILSTQTIQQKVQKLRVVDNSKWLDSNGNLYLPKEIVNLIDNKAYINRHKKLAREYGMTYLLKLAELAQTKAKPSRWYAKVTSVKQWAEQTEAMLSKLFKKLAELTEQLTGTGIDMKYLPYYLKAKMRLSEYKFNRCIENSRSKGVKSPPNLLAYSIKEALAEAGKRPQQLIEVF